jgi:hypothetical protein
MTDPEVFEPDRWCGLAYAEQRRLLAGAIARELDGVQGLREVRVEAGTLGREYDLTAAAETDAGVLRTPLWSHARSVIFCDPSIHPANRRQLTPLAAAREAAHRLRRRLAVPFVLESRGLRVTLAPEEGVERTWTAEHSRFRSRTAVTREDRVARPADLDVRDLLAHFYTGPSLRLVGADGQAFLLPAASEAEGPLVSLCQSCRRWSEGAHGACPDCGGPADTVVAARPSRR